MSNFFDPLSYENLGASIARALDDQPLELLREFPVFDGAGIYALYYSGDFPAYECMAKINQRKPGAWAIYIGKADADSTRKGNPLAAPQEVGRKLYNRLSKHRQSIEQAENLEVNDFFIRRLVISPTWVPLAESIALRLHHPLWNTLLDGLGNHDPGSGRYQGMKPKWDHVHPGRPWANRLQKARPETPKELADSAARYLHDNTPPELREFLL